MERCPPHSTSVHDTFRTIVDVGVGISLELFHHLRRHCEQPCFAAHGWIMLLVQRVLSCVSCDTRENRVCTEGQTYLVRKSAHTKHSPVKSFYEYTTTYAYIAKTFENSRTLKKPNGTIFFWRSRSITLHHSPPRSPKEQNAKQTQRHENIYLDILCDHLYTNERLAHAISCAFSSVFMRVLHVFPFIVKISVAC